MDGEIGGLGGGRRADLVLLDDGLKPQSTWYGGELVVENGKKIGTVNITTAGFPATRSGDSDIDAFVTLPEQCVAPIIFVMSGSEDKWFAVTGGEQ